LLGQFTGRERCRKYLSVGLHTAEYSMAQQCGDMFLLMITVYSV